MPPSPLSKIQDEIRMLQEKFKANCSWTLQLPEQVRVAQEQLRANFVFAPQQVVSITSEHSQTEITPPLAEATSPPAASPLANIVPQKLPRQNNPPTVARENDLHTFIERVCKKLMAEQKRFPKARAVFNAIRKRTEEFDEDCIIVKIENDTIEWKSIYGNIDTMKMASLANRISKIKPKVMKNNHR